MSATPVFLLGSRRLTCIATPADGRSLFSGRGRSNTETTLVSSVADDSRSVSTVYNPNAPVNSPVNGSIAGDGVDPDTLLDRVKTLTPMSDSGGKLSSVSSPEVIIHYGQQRQHGIG